MSSAADSERTTSEALATVGEHRSDADLRQKKLWVAVSAGPSLWLLEFVARYFAVEAGATHVLEPLLVAIAVAAAALTLMAVWFCRRVHRRAASPPGTRFLALLGALLNAFLALLMLVETLPHVFLDPGK